MSCMTLGGYPNTRPSLKGDPQQCHFPFKVGSVTYTSCIEFTDMKPFMTPVDPTELQEIPGLTSWCSLVPNYAKTDTTRRMWGYCVCPTNMPTQPAFTGKPTSSAPTKKPTTLAPTKKPTTNKPTKKNTPAPTKKSTKNPTSAPTTPTMWPSLQPTSFPTFVTLAPISSANTSQLDEILTNPIVAASLGIVGSIIIFGLFILFICCFRRSKPKRKSSAIVAYSPTSSEKEPITPFQSSPRRFRSTRPNWDEPSEIVVHSGHDEPISLPPSALPASRSQGRETEHPPLPSPAKASKSGGRFFGIRGKQNADDDVEEKSQEIAKPGQDLEKYRKMLRIGLSHDAIRHAMAKDGVPASLMPELN